MRRNWTSKEIMTKGKKMNLVATAYCNDPTTATGEKPIVNKTCAVDPKVIPYGSCIYIPELNLILRANDCGGAIKNNKIDIYLKDYKTCIQFGVKNLSAYVLTPNMM